MSERSYHGRRVGAFCGGVHVRCVGLVGRGMNTLNAILCVSAFVAGWVAAIVQFVAMSEFQRWLKKRG